MWSRKFKKGWHRFILIAALILSAMIIVPLAILPFWPDTAKEIRAWVEAYSGIFLIIAAMIAAYPVYLQLEESKINDRKMTIIGKQIAFEKECRRVGSVGELVEALIQLAQTKHCESMTAKRTLWLRDIADVRNEIKAKVDDIPNVSEKRKDFVSKPHELCHLLESDIRASPGETYFAILIHTAKELQRIIAEHNEACHTHREGLTKKLFEYEDQVSLKAT